MFKLVICRRDIIITNLKDLFFQMIIWKYFSFGPSIQKNHNLLQIDNSKDKLFWIANPEKWLFHIDNMEINYDRRINEGNFENFTIFTRYRKKKKVVSVGRKIAIWSTKYPTQILAQCLLLPTPRTIMRKAQCPSKLGFWQFQFLLLFSKYVKAEYK